MSTDPPLNIVVLVIDRLNAGFLGPYGNTWVQTPAINRFASQSRLYESAFATAAGLPAIYRSYWQGLHPLTPGDGPSLPQQWTNEGRRTLLVTDDPQVLELSGASEFQEQLLNRPPAVTASAESAAETQFGDLLQAALERLPQLSSPFALWLHARGLSGDWDAPLELREHLRDEEDPEAATFTTPPELWLEEDFDPDQLLAYTQAYAAQVMSIDECLETFWDVLQQSSQAEETLVVLTSPRGYLLGQQRYIGPTYDALLADLIHVPLLVRSPGGQHAAQRLHGLMETADLHRLLAQPGELLTPARDRVLLVSDHERALRTPAWYVRCILAEGDERYSRQELYAKPDDRYEVNDVAGRARPLLEELTQVLEATEQALLRSELETLEPLAEPFIDTMH